MRRFALALCLVAMAVQTFGQGFGHGGPGHGGPGHGYPGSFPGRGPGFQPSFQPVGPGGALDPNRVETCPMFWIEEKGSCYLFASGAFMNSMNGQGFTPIVVRQEGLFQMAANQFCHDKAAGARLVTINSRAENDFLYEWVIRMMVQPEPVWIGLHANAMGQWAWFSGEPVNYTNWEQGQYVPAEPGMGAMLFDADPMNQMNNQVDITAQWVPEQARNEPHFLMCEYSPNGMTAQPGPAATNAPAATTASAGAATTMVPQNPQNPQNPALYRNRPMNMGNFFGGRFGGSQLQEVGRRPANYRMNPYYAMP